MSPKHRVELFGTDGFIVSDLSSNYVELYADGKTLFKRGAVRFPVKSPMDSYALEFREFGDSILHDRQPSITAFDGLESLKVVRACYESSRIGQKITLN